MFLAARTRRCRTPAAPGSSPSRSRSTASGRRRSRRTGTARARTPRACRWSSTTLPLRLRGLPRARRGGDARSRRAAGVGPHGARRGAGGSRGGRRPPAFDAIENAWLLISLETRAGDLAPLAGGIFACLKFAALAFVIAYLIAGLALRLRPSRRVTPGCATLRADRNIGRPTCLPTSGHVQPTTRRRGGSMRGSERRRAISAATGVAALTAMAAILAGPIGGATAAPGPTDLKLTKADSPDPVVEDTGLAYTIQVQNLGSGRYRGCDRRGRHGHAALPGRLRLGHHCERDLHPGEPHGHLRPRDARRGRDRNGDDHRRPSDDGTISNTASVATTVMDTDQTNNQATESTTVSKAPDGSRRRPRSRSRRRARGSGRAAARRRSPARPPTTRSSAPAAST